MTLTTDQMIERYFSGAIEAVTALFDKALYGHVLIVIYSTIDTCGLLDAPATQVSASGDSFKNWVKKYLPANPGIEFNEIDLWAARCAVLHTFTSESDLSRAGKARELQYYSGDKSSPQGQHLISFTKSLDGGKHLPVHFGDLCEAFYAAIKKFIYDLDANCANSQAHADRLRNVLQVYPMAATP